MKRSGAFFFLAFFLHALCYSMPYDGKIQKFSQPNGNLVDLKLFGNEYYMRAEGLDGYTLIRDEKTKWICYARLSADETELISTGIPYKGKENDPNSLKINLNFSQHLDISEPGRQKIINQNKKRLNGNSPFSIHKPNKIQGTPIFPVSGNIKGLCLVIDFSDQPGTVPISEFQGFCNDLNYSGFGNNGSLRTYYKDISGGLLDYENVVYGYFRAPLTFAAYDAMPYAVGAQQILGLALNWVKNQGFDFSTLTLNPDSSIMAINMMYTGNPPNWAQGMWHHKGYYDDFSDNGIRSGDYNCSPANAPLSIGVLCHENGHMIGKWPDTYKYNSNTGPDGIGAYDIMCSYGNEFNPPPPNPLFRNNAGWEKVIDVSTFNGLVTDTANDNICFKYQNWNDTSEFYLMECCRKIGRRQSLPGDGLAIWHLDRNGDNQTTHHEVSLVHANNNINSHLNACFRGGYRPEFSESTTPKSDFYSGDPSGLKVWEISPRGQVMTYKIGAGQSGATFRLQFNGISGDNNDNGFAESGETALLNVSIKNIGQASSGYTKLKATAIGSTASFVSLNVDTLLLGEIQVNQNLPSSISFSVLPNTPLGTEINFRIWVSDGLSSMAILQKVIIGSQIFMASDSSTTCSGIFMDDGGSNNYQLNSENQKTIFPDQSGSKIKVKFLEFDVENGPGCGYDFLEIYDGPSMSSPIIGIFCGTDSPGEIESTDPSGALTFYFYSDGEVPRAGWKALVSCLTPLEIASKTIESVQILPNPTSGKIQIIKPNSNLSQVMIYDVFGKEILNTPISDKANQIDLSDHPEGIYWLKLQSFSGWVSQ
ncbi:MAG TPA: M6 family metalloprotease domain-containing protein, partial [Catalimonadaceae bacterium]|nr:M6 family metalloprotease domain-containing protein [Catalimonadaceae bacterium]